MVTDWDADCGKQVRGSGGIEGSGKLGTEFQLEGTKVWTWRHLLDRSFSLFLGHHSIQRLDLDILGCYSCESNHVDAIGVEI